jgi:hypothetical protein
VGKVRRIGESVTVKTTGEYRESLNTIISSLIYKTKCAKCRSIIRLALGSVVSLEEPVLVFRSSGVVLDWRLLGMAAPAV